MYLSSRLLLIGVLAAAFLQKGAENTFSTVVQTYIAASDGADTNLLFNETFEGDIPFEGLRLQFGTEHAFSIVTQPVWSGAKAGRFELRATDPETSNGTRAEVLFNVPDHKERWYSFSAYFPSDEYDVDSNNDIINQWHQGAGTGSPSTTLRVKNDRFLMRIGNTQESRKDIDLGVVQTKDMWHKFVFHIIHSNGSDGLVEVWHNGEKVLTYEGGNMYEGRLPRWKVGIYKDNWNGDRTTDSDKRVYYIDNIKVGNQNATLADM